MSLAARIRLVIAVTLISMMLGGVYALTRYDPSDPTTLASVWLRGAIIGGLIAAILASSELLMQRGEVGARARRSPFLVHLGLRSLWYLTIILVIPLVVNRLFPTATGARVEITRADIAFSLALSTCNSASTICSAREPFSPSSRGVITGPALKQGPCSSSTCAGRPRSRSDSARSDFSTFSTAS